jgi:hypothetical protein
LIYDQGATALQWGNYFLSINGTGVMDVSFHYKFINTTCF